ncbi:MAG: hypothetical protein ACK5P5_11640 [Pseudobdellovibrionaceae bacterium]
MVALVILVGFFIFVTISFIVIAVFFPEWVGITGKKALDIAREQQGLNPISETEKNRSPSDEKT